MKALVAICCGTLLCAAAQEPVDLEARRSSVATLKQHVEMRQKRLDELTAEIRERSGRTNRKVEDLVKMLAGLKDSQDSKRRVSQVKGEAVTGLKRMIETYQTERRKIFERLRTDGKAPDEALARDMAGIDQLIEKRVAEILELVKSMPGGEDVAKYENSGSSYYDGIYYEESRISEAWRQNRRDKVESGKQRRELIRALEKSIAALESRRDSIKGMMASGRFSGAEKELQEQELAHVSALAEGRRRQLAEIVRAGDPGDTPVSKDQADDLRELFGDARRDIAADFQKTLRLYHDAAAERDKLHRLKETLAAREKWLHENDPAVKKAE
jgi:septal ring factor EnvC (AmiA/AmiB activator)